MGGQGRQTILKSFTMWAGEKVQDGLSLATSCTVLIPSSVPRKWHDPFQTHQMALLRNLAAPTHEGKSLTKPGGRGTSQQNHLCTIANRSGFPYKPQCLEYYTDTLLWSVTFRFLNLNDIPPRRSSFSPKTIIFLLLKRKKMLSFKNICNISLGILTEWTWLVQVHPALMLNRSICSLLKVF